MNQLNEKAQCLRQHLIDAGWLPGLPFALSNPQEKGCYREKSFYYVPQDDPYTPEAAQKYALSDEEKAQIRQEYGYVMLWTAPELRTWPRVFNRLELLLSWAVNTGYTQIESVGKPLLSLTYEHNRREKTEKGELLV